MSDEIDRAQDQEAMQREAAIASARNKSHTISATGKCLECNKPLPEGMRWCDNYCRDDWQRWNPGM